MIRGSNNWKCRCDLICNIKACGDINKGIAATQQRWGRGRVLHIYRLHVKPLVRKTMRRTKDFQELF
jgi:hypothetical protein